ncbi:MAG: SHOCT-like domain-containing protein, partial [Anaerolineales bacterium]
AELSAGGDLRVTGAEVAGIEWGGASFKLAGGDHLLSISAGGDLWLSVGESDEPPVEMADLGGTIAAKVGEKIAEMEAALSAMGAEMDMVSSEMISDRVQRMVDRAVRKSERVEARASLKEAIERGFASDAGASDEERMKVLKLLEEKKITVEQAEELLAALEA